MLDIAYIIGSFVYAHVTLLVITVTLWYSGLVALSVRY